MTDKLKVCRQIPLLQWLDFYFFLTVLEVESVPLSWQMFQLKALLMLILFRVALMMVFWHPGLEEVETERGNGRKNSPTRARNWTRINGPKKG